MIRRLILVGTITYLTGLRIYLSVYETIVREITLFAMVRIGRPSLRKSTNIPLKANLHRLSRIAKIRKFGLKHYRRLLPLRSQNFSHEVSRVRIPHDCIELPGHCSKNDNTLDTLASSDSTIYPASNPRESEIRSDIILASEPDQSLAFSLRSVLASFFESRAGGQMTDSGTITTVNRICQFIEWAHRQLHNDQAPSTDLIVSPRRILEWFMEAISTNPHILEEYIGYQFTTIQRSPSTIINHMDALVQCYNFIVYDGRLTDGGTSPIEVNTQFTTRFPFFNKRCRRTLRKQLKKHKYKYILTITF